jgi:hypothetical protein
MFTFFVVGSCCRDGGCEISLKTECDEERFVVGEHTCKYDCGSCCGGNVNNNCGDNYTRQQCTKDNGQFNINGVCSNDCGKNERVSFIIENITHSLYC